MLLKIKDAINIDFKKYVNKTFKNNETFFIFERKFVQI